MTKYDVFLSHNGADKAAVELLAHQLREQVGLNPFLDKWHLVPGKPWQEALEVALGESATVAVFIGPSGVSPWHNEEMRSALDEAVRTRDEYRVIPVLLPGASEEAMVRFMSRRTWVDFRSGLDDAEAFERLVAGIKGEAVAGGSYTLPDEPAPYRGLLRFEETQARFFFGREADGQTLINKLSKNTFVAVIGASGSGKSSLVRAGLIPQLKKSAISGSDAWPVLVFTPGSHPIQALAEQLATFVPQSDRLKLVDDLTARLSKRFDGLRTAVRALLPNELQPIFLFIDQFEELFTLCQEQNEICRQQAEQFVANLMDAVKSGDGCIRVLITLRADFLDRCLTIANLRDLLQDRQFLLGALDEASLREAIVRPAQVVDAFFEKGLVNTILHDVGVEPGNLPLLQHALYELWLARRGPWLTLDAYEASGGVKGSLQRRAQATYDALSLEQQSLARNIFLRLTALGEGISDTRRRAMRTELYLTRVDPTQVDVVLQVLSGPQARLIVANKQTVEIAHEALIQQWPMLRRWLEEDREGLRIHYHLSEDAQEWVALKQDPGILYRGARLVQANEWADTHSGDLNTLEHKFLEASNALQVNELEAAKAQTKQLRRRAFYLIGALIITLLALAFAWWQGRIAYSRELAASSISELSLDPELSTMLALQAMSETYFVQRFITAEALDALHRAVQASYIQMTLAGHAGSVTDVVFSPEGRRLATAGADGTAKIWDAVSGKELLSLSGHTNVVLGVAFSPDGAYIATASWDKTAKLWDATSGQELLTFSGHNGRVRGAAFSPDGRRLATASDDNTAKIWNITSGHELFTLKGHNDWVKAVVFSPDGKFLATASDDETAKIWDAMSGRLLLTLIGHTYLVSGVAFSPDGIYLATASDDRTAKIWNTTSGRNILTLTGHTNAVFGVAFSPDGRRLATASVDGTVKVWDFSSGRELFTLSGHTNPINSVTFSPDGTRLATASVDGTGRVWSVPFSHNSFVTDVAFSPDGKYLATASDDKTAKIWDVVSGRELLTLFGHTDQVKGVTFSANGMRLATASDDKTAKVWDAISGKVLLTLRGHTRGVNSVAFSPDGKYLVTTSDDKTVKVWGLLSGREKFTLLDYTNWVAAAAFSPDGKVLTTAAGDGVKLREAMTGKELFTLTTDQIYHVAFSPDGKQLATADLNNIARVWNTSSGEQLLTLSGHTNAVFSIAFSPDGSRIATASWDKTTRVWDATSGQELLTLNHTAEVNGIAFSPDGARLATASADKRAHIYLLNTDDLITLTKTRLARSFTSAECRKFLHTDICPRVP